MIELDNIGLLNWFMFEAEDIPVFGATAIIGENRSGKSTILDQMKTVLTGNNGTYVHLNSNARSGRSGKGGRTVQAYCLGRYGEGDDVLRDQARTYIYLGFSDDNNRPVTIGLALEAKRSEANAETLGLFIVDGLNLRKHDFLEPDGNGGMRPKEWDEVRFDLEERCKERGGEFRVCGNSKEFVENYLHRLSTNNRPILQREFFKAFSMASNISAIENATNFIRSYVLEDKPISVGELRDSIRKYREIKENIVSLTDKLAKLNQMKSASQEFAQKLEKDDFLRWALAAVKVMHSRREFLKNTDRLKLANRDVTSIERDMEEHGERQQALTNELEALRLVLHADGYAQKRSLIEKDKSALERTLRDEEEQIKMTHGAFKRASAIVRWEDMVPEQFDDLLKSLKAMRESLKAEDAVNWMASNTNKEDELPALSRRCREMVLYCDGQAQDALRESGGWYVEIKKHLRTLEELKSSGNAISPIAQDLFAELSARQMDPRYVCADLEVTNEDWRNAAEALLGRDREAIIVDPEHVDEAVRTLRRLQRENKVFYACRIVNTRKIKAEWPDIKPETLASVLISNDIYVMGFIARRIGNVRLAKDQQDLHLPGRAIMQDGTYDDGLVIQRRRADILKIGKSVAQQSEQAILQNLQILKEKVSGYERENKTYMSMADALREATGLPEEQFALGAMLDRYGDAYNKIEDKSLELSALDQEIDPETQNRITATKGQISDIKDDLNRLNSKRDSARDRVSKFSGRISSGEGEVGSKLNMQACRDRYRTIRLGEDRHISWKPIQPQWRNGLRSELIKNISLLKLTENLIRDKKGTNDCIDELRKKVEKRVYQFNLDYPSSLKFDEAEDSIVSDLLPQLCDQIEYIEKTELTRYQEESEGALEQAKSSLKNSFLGELQGRIAGVENELRRLNSILRPHTFHHEKYSFKSTPAAAYADIITFAQAVSENDDLATALFDDRIDQDHPYAQALNKVQELLESDEIDFIDFEDYRKYYVFELYMKNVETGQISRFSNRQKTGSGGEHDTPFYVAIGAALASVYHAGGQGVENSKRGIAIMPLDEAFSKLDMNNRRACMDFYRSLGLQPIIAAPMVARAGFVEIMDHIVEVYRDDTAKTVNIDSATPGPKARDAFRRENPENLNLDQVREFINQQAEL